ncbi:hypothetical protein MMC14_003735 [Varicellaria rhodocarpa]|nr:hypothetical protein [Varicellaria rhodocarpa]
MDTVFWIASCTKLIGAIAVMQLVEQGKLALDDADIIEKVCPELRDIKILKSISADGMPEMAMSIRSSGGNLIGAQAGLG